jgi:cytochrome b
MNATSASRAETHPSLPRRILVWDAPVRVFHWLMVLSFAGAWLTAESERFRLLHVTLGYTMAGLVAFRIVWGLIGSRHARFSSFVRGLRAVAAHLGSVLRGRPERHPGHNPAGAVIIVALLVLTLAAAGSGWANYNEIAGDWLEDVHEAAATTMLFVVLLHVAGVIATSLLHRENLVRAMITGRKTGTPDDGIRRAWHTVAVLMLTSVMGFWWLQWQGAPAGTDLVDRHAVSHEATVDEDQD